MQQTTNPTPKKVDTAFLPEFWVGRYVGYPLEIRKVSLHVDFYLRTMLASQYEQESETAYLFTTPILSTWAALTVRGCSQTILRAVAYMLRKDLEWVKDNTTLAECVGILMKALHTPDGKSDEAPEGRIKAEQDKWNLAGIIDFFGRMYNWTADDVMSLTRHEIDEITEAIKKSEKEQGKRQKDDGNRRLVNDARTEQDPTGIEGVMSFAAQHGVLKGKG